MTQFVVDRLEVLEDDTGAHSDAEIFGVVEIPGGGVTGNFPTVCWFLQHGQGPESVGHRFETHRSVEIVSGAEHPLDGVILADHFGRRIGGRFVRIRDGDFVQIDPETAPHVAQQVSGQRSAQVDFARPVSIVEFATDVSVQLLVQRFHLGVEILDDRFHLSRLVLLPPLVPVICVAVELGLFVLQFDIAQVKRTQLATDPVVPSLPRP